MNFERKMEVATTAKDEIRLQNVRSCQDRWNQEYRWRWNARLVRHLDTWINRGHGKVNYYLMQFHLSHGYLRSYFNKTGNVENPGFVYCQSHRDDGFTPFLNGTDGWYNENPLMSSFLKALVLARILNFLRVKVEQHWLRWWELYIRDVIFSVCRENVT